MVKLGKLESEMSTLAPIGDTLREIIWSLDMFNAGLTIMPVRKSFSVQVDDPSRKRGSLKRT